MFENPTGAIKMERMSQIVCAAESDDRWVRGEKVFFSVLKSKCRVIRWAKKRARPVETVILCSSSCAHSPLNT